MSDEPKPPPDAPPAPPAPLSSAEAKVRAAMADAGLQQALRELDDSLHEPDPPAPDPVVVIPEKGEVLVTDTEAAAAYVQPMVRRARPLPQDTLTRVRVDVRVDPRRQPTERRLRSEVVPKEAAPPSTPPITVAEPPSARDEAPRSRKARPRVVMAAAISLGATLALLVYFVLRSGSGVTDAGAQGGAAMLSTASLGATPPSPSPSDPAIEASTGLPTVPSASTADPAPATSSTSSAAVVTTSSAAAVTTSSAAAVTTPTVRAVPSETPPSKSLPTSDASAAPSAVPSAAPTTTPGQVPIYEDP